VMANLNNLMVTEKMVSINTLYEEKQKNLGKPQNNLENPQNNLEKPRKIWKKPKTNKTKQKKYLEYHAFVEHVFFAAGPQYLVRPTLPI